MTETMTSLLKFTAVMAVFMYASSLAAAGPF